MQQLPKILPTLKCLLCLRLFQTLLCALGIRSAHGLSGKTQSSIFHKVAVVNLCGNHVRPTHSELHECNLCTLFEFSFRRYTKKLMAINAFILISPGGMPT